MSQDNKPNLPGWAAIITAIAALITAIGSQVLFPDLVKRFLPSEEPVAQKEKQSVTPKLEENPVPSPEVSPNPGNTLKPLEDLVIIVKDSETKEVLDNADIIITYRKGIIPGRTIGDGTYRLQIPPQDLGEITILVRKEGYQQKEMRKDFDVNPNEPLPIYLEPDSTNKPPIYLEPDPNNNSQTPEGDDNVTTPRIRTLNWEDTAKEYRGRLGQYFTFNCPPGGSANHDIWGTDIYTDDSSICTAAVHSELINTTYGGQVTIRIEPRQEFYEGTFRGQVESKNYDKKYYGSFSFPEAEAEEGIHV